MPPNQYGCRGVVANIIWGMPIRQTALKIMPTPNNNNNNNNSVALVCERTIPTKRPPLVSDVSANFLRIEVCRVVSVTDPYDRILGFLDQRRYFFLPSSISIVLTRLSGLRSRPTTSLKIWYLRESKPDLWIWTQELWPLGHRIITLLNHKIHDLWLLLSEQFFPELLFSSTHYIQDNYSSNISTL
jgi:hypothetical protein